MKTSSRILSGSRPYLVACSLLLVAVLSTGCESLQRKLTRKSNHPAPPPSPIIQFQDYTRTLTPLDRYRKHYLMFDYWNSELISALQGSSLNPKRVRRASMESLAELNTMKGLLADDVAARLAPVIEERAKIDHRLQSGSFGAAEASPVWRALEFQTRQVNREFFWRDVEEHLNASPQDESTAHRP